MLGACHALAHPLGAIAGVPHGVANGVFLEPVLRANAAKVGARYAALGPTLGVAVDADAVIDVVCAFVHETARVPRRLRELTLGEDSLPRLAAAAALDPDLPTNPVRLDEAALLSIVRERW
jgi:alcohol dehydrogenase class IV